MANNQSASDVLDDLITTVCGDSVIVRPFLKKRSPPRRRSKSPNKRRKTISNGDTPTGSINSSFNSSSRCTTSKKSNGGKMLSDSYANRSHDSDIGRKRYSTDSSSRGSRKRKRSESRSPVMDDCFYECNICHDEFRQPQILCYHLYHNHQLPACCAYCNKHFFDTSLLMRHIKMAHTGKMALDCWFCPFKPSGMRRFWDHMWHSHKKNMYRCRNCGQICFSKACFKVHQSLCVKLKMKTLNKARSERTSCSNNNNNKQSKRLEKPKSVNFFNRFSENFQSFPKEISCCPPGTENDLYMDANCPVSSDIPTPPMQITTPSDMWNMAPYGYMNPYHRPSSYQPIPYPGFRLDPLLKDPRITKIILNNENHLVKRESEGMTGEGQTPLVEMKHPIASSTPVKMTSGTNGAQSNQMAASNPQTLRQVSGDHQQQPQTVNNSAASGVKQMKPTVSAKSIWSTGNFVPTVVPCALPVMQQQQQQQDAKTNSNSSQMRPVFAPFSLKLEPSPPEKSPSDASKLMLEVKDKVLPCGCSGAVMNHYCCDILNNLNKEIEANDNKQTTVADKVSSAAATVLASATNVAKVNQSSPTTCAAVGSSLSKPTVKAQPKVKSLEIQKKNIEKIRQNVSKVKKLISLTSPPKKKTPAAAKEEVASLIDLTSPLKCESNTKKANSCSKTTNACKSTKVLSFAKMEQIANKKGKKKATTSNNKTGCGEEKEKPSTAKTTVVSAAKLSSAYRIPIKVKPEVVISLNQAEVEIKPAVVVKKEVNVPPKKRWASEYIVDQLPLPHSQPPTVQQNTVENEKRPTYRIETEFLCDLCEYRGLEKKHMEKHLKKKHFVTVAADRFVNYCSTYEVHKTVIDRGETPTVDRENKLHVKFENLCKEVETLKQCLRLMKPDMKR